VIPDVQQNVSAITGFSDVVVCCIDQCHCGSKGDFTENGTHANRLFAGIIGRWNGRVFLTDTAEYHYRAWQKLADEAQLPFDRQANEALRAVSRRESLQLIIGSRPYSETAIAEMMDRKNRYYVESIQSITPQDALPGAVDLLDELRRCASWRSEYCVAKFDWDPLEQSQNSIR
jgi:hypothetical protein